MQFYYTLRIPHFCSKILDFTLLQLFIVIAIYFGSEAFTIKNQVFLKNKTWDGLVVTDEYHAKVTGRNAMDCGLACSLTDECESFFYTSIDRNCYLFNDVIESNTCAGSVTGARYYYLQGSYPDPGSTLCNGGPKYPTCDDSDDTFYRNVLLTDGTPFTYRVYRTPVSQGVALANCANENTELVKVLTLEKMQFLRHLIVNCSDYNLFSFWIDGSNANALDFQDITQWVTTDGQSLPSSDDFWVSGHPNSPTIDHCVPMWQALGHYWTDRPCTDLFPYICEMPIP